MRLGTILGVLLLASTGCGSSAARPCQRVADCEPNESCDEAQGLCVPATPICRPECLTPHQCVGNNVCVPRYSRVVLKSPLPGTLFGAGGVEVRVALEVEAGRERNDPFTLTLEARGASGTAQRVELWRTGRGAYTGRLAPVEAGSIQLVALYELGGLRSEAVVVEAELTGPELAVKVPEAPARIDGGETSGYDPEPGFGAAWRRDEKVQLWVVSNTEDLDAESVRLEIRGTNGKQPLGSSRANPVEQVSTGCDASYCGTVEVDLSAPQMLAFRGEFTLVVSAEDERGNAGGGEGSVKVTRWKWQSTSSMDAVGGTPAIGTDGTVYFGTTGSGILAAASPEGEVRWARKLGASVTSPVFGVGSEGEFLAVASSSEGNARVYVLDSSDGSELEACSSPTIGVPEAAMVAGVTDRAGESGLPTIIAHVNSGAGTLLLVRWGSHTPCQTIEGAGQVPHARNLIFSDDQLYVPSTGGVQAFRYLEGYLSPSATWDPDMPNPSGGLSFFEGTLVRLAGSELKDLVTGLDPDYGRTMWSLAVEDAAGLPVIGEPDSLVIAKSNGGLQRTNLAAASTMYRMGNGGTTAFAPLIGRDQSVYVSRTHRLEAWSSSLSYDWSFAPNAVLSTGPAIDCARGLDGQKLPQRPGTLYFGTSAPPGLYAIIVDSRGLDTAAPWPKHQRDPWNSGNTATDLSQFACE